MCEKHRKASIAGMVCQDHMVRDRVRGAGMRQILGPYRPLWELKLFPENNGSHWRVSGQEGTGSDLSFN